jgi:hypothetical protein
MKRIWVGVLLLLASATASAQFEGVADFRVTMFGEKGKSVPSTGKVFVTRNGYRSEWETQFDASTRAPKSAEEKAVPRRVKMTMFGRAAEPDKLYMINDENKTYSVMDLKKIREEARNASKETYTVQKLGTDTVAGISCQQGLVTSSRGNEFEVCVSKDWRMSGEWLAGMQRNRNASSWLAALRENGLEGFPIRWVMRRKGSPEPAVIMELTHAERKSLPSSLFEVPEGYKESGSGVGGLTPEQEKMMRDARAKALENMTPEQRKEIEDAMKAYAVPTPKPTP